MVAKERRQILGSAQIGHHDSIDESGSVSGEPKQSGHTPLGAERERGDQLQQVLRAARANLSSDRGRLLGNGFGCGRKIDPISA
ncbi:MAG: hypothetical protein WAL41_23355, partial [Mycobacterium sp.]